MTGLTKECITCSGTGFGDCYWCGSEGCSTCMVSDAPEDYYDCDACDATGRVPVTESDLEAHGQERLPL